MDDVMRRVGHALRAEVESTVDVEDAWTGFVARAAAAPPENRPAPTRWGWMLAAAAVVALVIGGAALLVRDGGDTVRTTDVPTTPAVTPPATISVAPQPATTPATPPPPVTTAPATTPATSAPAPTSAPVVTPSAPTTTPAGELPPLVALDDLLWEYSGIARQCADDACTQLAVDPTGTIVSYDPDTRTLTRRSVPPVVAGVPFDGDVVLITAGPDGAVYLATPTGSDPIGDLVAVSLTDGDAGREIERLVGTVDLSGDTDLVATAEGLVEVGCCGPDQLRPAPDAAIVIGWVGPSPTAQPPATVRFDTAGTVIGDVSWDVGLAENVGLRGMPRIVTTFDGGFIGAFADVGGAFVTIGRGWPDGSVDTVDVAEWPALLEPGGTALFEDGERFRRVAVFGEPAGGPTPLTYDFDGDPWTVTAAGLNDEIDRDRPAWAGDPISFADHVAGPLAVNESRSIAVVPAANDVTVTVTTANLFDDSVRATRLTLHLTPTELGAHHFVSGTFANACQPDRGHQDFRSELCV